MYRGSRLAASFLLVLTGSAATAAGLGVVPPARRAERLADRRARRRVRNRPLRRAVRARPGPRVGPDLAVTIAEIGGGLSFAGLFAIALGANPFAGSALPAQQAVANGTGLVAWTLAMYLLLGISAGRVRFQGWSRRSAWWPTPLLGCAGSRLDDAGLGPPLRATSGQWSRSSASHSVGRPPSAADTLQPRSLSVLAPPSQPRPSATNSVAPRSRSRSRRPG